MKCYTFWLFQSPKKVSCCASITLRPLIDFSTEHAFLIEVLRAYNLPEEVMNAVKTLYSNAQTRLKLNGRLSAPFTVVHS